MTEQPNPRPTEELLPCPFCGGEVGLSLNYRDGRQLWYVVCETADCYVAFEGHNHAQIIAAWNRRATPRPTDAQNGETCATRGGGRTVTGSEHAPKCDGYTCADDCPIPVPLPCPSCAPEPAQSACQKCNDTGFYKESDGATLICECPSAPFPFNIPQRQGGK